MTETATVEETNEQTAETNKDEALAERHGYIDFDKIEDPDVRKVVQERFNGLYRSNKETATALEEMQRLYGGMQKEMADLKAQKAKESTDAQLAKTRKDLADAQAKGDYEAAAQHTDKLVELKTPKPEPKAESEDRLSPAEESALFRWQAEMTDDGRIVRPWANSGSPRYRETIAALTKAYNTPEIASQGFGAVLEAVHQHMSPKPKQESPVSNSDTSTPRKSDKEVKLTAEQIHIARKMYPKSVLERIGEKDPIVAYQKALKKYGDQ